MDVEKPLSRIDLTVSVLWTHFQLNHLGGTQECVKLGNLTFFLEFGGKTYSTLIQASVQSARKHQYSCAEETFFFFIF